MFLKITPAVQKRLNKYLKQPALKVLLNFDDGVGLYSRVQATCSLEVNFNLIIVNSSADLTDFDSQVNTSMGSFLIKGYSKEFLDEKNRLFLTKFGSLCLTGDRTGLIANNLPIIDLSQTTEKPKIGLEPIDEIAN
ncbi:hypothetical protein FC89_GL000961 [Liquorilactobacillus ghanensis DSM 18630]|jgi:uncharacterized protein YqkB|uniref:Core domain-containing protein n=1 Tax=Liquorilactobacillus ghanensis DSM 18630 TaxID=1423750 RepID=A0A0R1VJW9_9LACO|nr:iron-sulfur cluster biosynthesis family protein [Liquorilactobacillus ghanensis]KRM06094.1 hypothetical protein FC89_GL000961 [Liquorilactobacillus ghanensis DSM 18630]